MFSSIKSVSVSYDAINESNSFSGGERIAGQVTLEVAKEVKVTRLAVKAKGEAYVSWSEKSGDDENSYCARERYFKVKQLLVADRKSDGKDSEALLSGDTFSNVISPGTHVYPFSFQIPEGNFPSSFKGVHGYIAYTLEAKLSRSMRMPSVAKAEFTIYSKPHANTNQLMEPLFGAVQKKMKFFTSGIVSMNVTVDKAGYVQGAVTVTRKKLSCLVLSHEDV